MGFPSRLRIGISACLLGQQVRYDGGHKRDAFLTDVLGPHVEWISVCPEVELGLGTPRETLHLVRSDQGIRMVTTGTRIDHTDAMERWARARVEALAREDLSGYVLKANSPSCGMNGVKVFGPDGMPELDDGTGLFARALLERFPTLPVEEETRLADPELRDHFIGRVFAYRRLQDLFGSPWTIGDLVRFHTAHEMLLCAHSPAHYRELGRLVASASERARDGLRARYESEFMRALASQPTRGTHTDALMHMAGHLKDVLDVGSTREVLNAVDEYRRGSSTLEKPLMLIRQHATAHDVDYLRAQVFLEANPAERILPRNLSEKHDPRSSAQIRA